MSELKIPLDVDVLEAAQIRIQYIFDEFPKVCLSFSAGKDSTVMLQLVADEARRRNRKFALLLIDLEAQYAATIEHGENMFAEYRDCTEQYWVSLPFNLRNAVSMFAPRWQCWDPDRKESWVRQPPPFAITDQSFFPFFRRGMEFEEFVDEFGAWYAGNILTACLVGIRTDESLNRFRTIASRSKTFYQRERWTTWKRGALYNAYPIYDWKTKDVWTYTAKFKKPYNRIYDLMHQAGLSVHQMRICQPYGDDQRKGLWLFHILEPATWPKVVARVGGANAGALYAKERGNVLGNHGITKPSNISWKEYAELLVESLPPDAKSQFQAKINQFLVWWERNGYSLGMIPDEADPKLEAARKVPSWRRVCKAILKNDYWCKSLSFSQTKSATYETFLKRRLKMKLWKAGAIN